MAVGIKLKDQRQWQHVAFKGNHYYKTMATGLLEWKNTTSQGNTKRTRNVSELKLVHTHASYVLLLLLLLLSHINSCQTSRARDHTKVLEP